MRFEIVLLGQPERAYAYQQTLKSIFQLLTTFSGENVGLPEFLRLRSICFQRVAFVAFLKPVEGMLRLEAIEPLSMRLFSSRALIKLCPISFRLTRIGERPSSRGAGEAAGSA